MSNELQTQEAIDQLAQSIDVDSSNLNALGSDFIPILTVASSLSGSVDAGIARPGEFVLAKTTSLGTQIECAVLAYRLHAALIDTNSFSFVESQYVQMGEETPKAYKDFVTMNPPADHEIQEGADLFLYIPSANSFATIFMKKTLARCVNPIWSTGRGGRIVILRTELNKNRTGTRKWYTIVPGSTNQALTVSKLEGVEKNVAMDMELYAKYSHQFRNPPISAAETVSADTDSETIDR